MVYHCSVQVGGNPCGRALASPYHLYRHQLDCHGVEPPSKYKTYACTVEGCHVQKMTAEERDNHVLAGHGNRAECPEGCGATFATATTARIHKRKCRGEGVKRKKFEKMRLCFNCGKVFKGTKVLKQHQKAICNNNNNDKVKFSCPFSNCGKQFVHKRNLSSHEKSHAAKAEKMEDDDVADLTSSENLLSLNLKEENAFVTSVEASSKLKTVQQFKMPRGRPALGKKETAAVTEEEDTAAVAENNNNDSGFNDDENNEDPLNVERLCRRGKGGTCR